MFDWKQTLTTKALIHENYQHWPQEILTPLSVEPIYDSTYISGQSFDSGRKYNSSMIKFKK